MPTVSENCPDMARCLPPPGLVTADHPVAVAVNPDASRFFAGRDNCGPARHERCGHGGWSDSACRQHAGHDGGPPAHSRRRSRSGRGRSSCKSAPGHGTGRIGRTGQPYPRSVPGRRTDVDEIGDGWNTALAFVPGTMWGVAPNPTWPLRESAAPIFQSWQRLTLSRCAVSARRRRASPARSIPPRARL